MTAQEPAKPVLKQGVHVQLAVASRAVEMRQADEQDATVIALTADGAIFNGTQRVNVASLGSLGKGVVFFKADARAPYQKVLAVLDALNGRQVALLTASPTTPRNGQYMPPYGVKITVGQ
jgi:biopolymer transport protein ExbD